MDLTPYTCRGFPGDFDRIMRDVPVAGIDRQQTHSMVRVCAQTHEFVYGPHFSPRRIRYRAGSRPKLEAIAAPFRDHIVGDLDPLMQWVRENVRHPHFAGHVAPDRALGEEDLIGSGVGWCNEQCRVFIALAEVLGYPARLCFLFHVNGRTGHTACEVYHGSWRFYDVTHGIYVPLETRSIWQDDHGRRACDLMYAQPLANYYEGRTAPFDITRGGDFFNAIGITNYLIDGVEAV